MDDLMIKNDGWNESVLEDMGLMEVLLDCIKVKYEIENCRRGSYVIDGVEPNDMLIKLKNISEKLNEVIDEMEFVVEDFDMDKFERTLMKWMENFNEEGYHHLL